jgi:hypothetical protein
MPRVQLAGADILFCILIILLLPVFDGISCAFTG